MPNMDIIYSQYADFKSKYALCKSNVGLKFTETDIAAIALESLIFANVDDRKMGEPKLELDFNKIAIHYHSMLNQFYKHFKDFKKHTYVRDKKENLTTYDFLEGLKRRGRGRPPKNPTPKEERDIYSGKMYVDFYINNLDMKVLENTTGESFHTKHSIYRYEPKIEDDKLILELRNFEK